MNLESAPYFSILPFATSGNDFTSVRRKGVDPKVPDPADSEGKHHLQIDTPVGRLGVKYASRQRG